MSYTGNPLYSSPLYIPIKYSRKYGRAYDNGGWRGVLYTTYSSSLEDTVDYPIFDTAEYRGPGYLGYIFYMIYDMNLMYRVYREIASRLLRRDLDDIHSRLRSKHHYIRRAFKDMFTSYELSFMNMYGWDINRFLSRIVNLSFMYEVPNDMYSREFKRIWHLVNDSRLNYDFPTEYYMKILTVLMRFGIGISLYHRLRLLEYSSFFYYGREVLNGIDFDTVIDGYEIFISMARYYGMEYLIERDLYPHRYSVILSKGFLELGGGNDVVFKGYSCIFPTIARHLPDIYRTRYNVNMVRKTLMPICKICRSLLSSFIVSKGYGVSVSNHSVSGSNCEIVFTIYKEEVGGREYEAI